jgi:hypothetical protein
VGLGFLCIVTFTYWREMDKDPSSLDMCFFVAMV